MPDSFTASRFRQLMSLPANQYSINPDEGIFEYSNPNVRITSVFQPDFARNNADLFGQSPNDDLVKILETTHPHFDEFHLRWGDWYNWYAGQNIQNYLDRHHREKIENYRKRQARAYYYNYTGSIVDLISSFVYTKNVTRSFFKQDEQLAEQEHIEKNEFWADCDLRKSTIDEFMEKIHTFAKIWGFIDVVTDMPRTTYEITNEQERLDAQIRPYLYYILPMNAINWEFDDKGEFLWYRWKEKMDKQYNPFGSRPKASIHHYWTWTRDAWYKHEVVRVGGRKPEARLLDAGQHSLGVVPVTRFFGKRDMLDTQLGQSFVEPIGKINVDIANSVSLLTEEIRSKVFNILVMEDPNQMNDNEAAGSVPVEIGNNNALLWAGTNPPYYLAPASDPGRFIVEWVEKSTDTIYKLATLWTDSGIRESRPGVSYSYEFNRTNTMLADTAQLMEEGEIKVHMLYCKWLGEEWLGSIDYPDNYDVEVFEQELERATDAKKAIRSPTFAREVEKSLARKALKKSTTDILEQVMQEIDTLEEKIPIEVAATLQSQEKVAEETAESFNAPPQGE
jgi:hypothetical protein